MRLAPRAKTKLFKNCLGEYSLEKAAKPCVYIAVSFFSVISFLGWFLLSIIDVINNNIKLVIKVKAKTFYGKHCCHVEAIVAHSGV